MAVITKYIVVRNGVELDKEFLVKKAADAYDKMLDAADKLAALIKDAELDIDVDEKAIDALAVFLAKNGPEVTRILKGVKPIGPPVKKPEANKVTVPTATAKKKIPAAKTSAVGKKSNR
jgi:dsDNA-binding SOS-regulon protein